MTEHIVPWTPDSCHLSHLFQPVHGGDGAGGGPSPAAAVAEQPVHQDGPHARVLQE